MASSVNVSGQIGGWVEEFNIRIKRVDERPDQPSGDIIYRVKDIFTTRDGSWDPSNQPGSIDSWARERYLRHIFDDAGGDHHLFARVLDINGNAITEDICVMWSDGFDKLGDPSYNGYVTLDTKVHSGWGNQPVFNAFNYAAGNSGAWCWCPKGPAEVVCGGGLPAGMHVSFFVVWQAERRSTIQPPDGGVGGGIVDGELAVEQVRRAAWSKMGLTTFRDTKFANYARINTLGAPLTNEFTANGFQMQGFVGGIVFAPTAQPTQIDHVPW